VTAMIRIAFQSVICAFFILLATVVRGQVPTDVPAENVEYQSNIAGPLEFKGHVKELSRKLKGAIVTLSESKDGSHDGLVEIMRTVTPGSGEFTFKLEINKFYVLSVELGGYTTKKVDFDTDVRMARPEHTKVPLFEFEVDMVKDLDGLAFSKAVASVFYQIKQNEFDYQLDYSKEEMEEEERLLREQQEKQRLAELAAQKKFELEEAAKLMRDKENASAQQLIQAAVTLGEGNKDKTIKGFLDVFSEADTLRNKKAIAMYEQLLEERKSSQATGGKINFQSIFAAAQKLEAEVVKKAEQERSSKVETLRSEKLAVEQKKQEALAIQQQALELESKEKMAAAAKQEELKKKAEEKDRNDKVYYAIFNSSGNSEVAIQNLIKAYPKEDKYKEQKAKAIYAEYEKARLTGTTLSQIDFNKLFAAASAAEQKAIQDEIARDNAKKNAKLEAFIQKVEETKQDEQQQIIQKLEAGLKDAPKDKVSQLAIFKDALSKNDPYKDVKADAMYEEFFQQQRIIRDVEAGLKIAPNSPSAQKAVFLNAIPEGTPDREQKAEEMYNDWVQKRQAQGGSAAVTMDFGALFNVAQNAEEQAKNDAKLELVKEKREAQEKLEAKQEAVRQERTELANKVAEQTRGVQQNLLTEAQKKKEQELAMAIEQGGGDRDKSVQAIMKTLTTTGDRETDLDRAEAVYDAYLTETKKLKQSGNSGGQIDYSALFKAADNAELAKLQRQNDLKQAEEEKKLAAYQENRIQKATEIAQAQKLEAQKEVELAEKTYENTLAKVEAQRQERIAEQKKQEEELAKTVAMQQAKREAVEQERADEILAAVQKDQQERLERERKEAETLAAKQDAERREQERVAKLEADKMLAEAEKARKDAELAAARAEADRMKEEQKRIEAEEKTKRESEVLAKKLDDERRKEEERIATEKEKERVAAELAAKQAEENRVKEGLRVAAEQEKARVAADLAAKKAEEDRIKDEQRVAAEQEKARVAADLAAKQAEDNRIKEEQRIAAEQAKAAAAAALAAKQAEENRIKEEARLAKELADRQAAEAEQKRKDEYSKLISDGDLATAQKNHRKALESYTKAAAMYPENRDVAKKVSDSQVEVKRIEQEEAAQLALDDQFNKIMSEAAQAQKAGDLVYAKNKYTKASELKPNATEPKAQIKEIEKQEAQIAQSKKEEQAKERQYILLMEEGNKALAANNFTVAKQKFGEAGLLKPEEAEPMAKLNVITTKEEELALAAADKKRKEDEAKRKFEEQQAAERKLKEEMAAARLEAIGTSENSKTQQQLTLAEQEKIRIEKYEKLKTSIEQMDLEAEEQRRAFLSELAKLYPQGLTKEQVQGKNFVLTRHVINEGGQVTIYEKKTWDWGGVFYFKNSDIAITEAIYQLEIGKYKE